MDDDQRYDPLTTENDYEGGQWIGGEFFYRSKRQKTHQTEEDRLYGIFANEDSSDDERRRRRGERKAKPNYARPVSFVSSGQFQPGNEEEEEEEEEEKAACTFPQFHTAGPKFPQAADPSGEVQENDEEDESVLPTAFGRRIREKAARRERQEKDQFEVDQAWKDASKMGFASFEKYGKGIGSKLLAKMGYKPGTGLGRDGKGIVKPLEQKLRPKNMGMGYGDFRERGLGATPEQAKEEEKATAKTPVPQKLWKKKRGTDRQKRVYKTADELLKEETEATPMDVQPILDMRGPKARVITNLEHLNVEEKGELGERTPMPELQHNMRLLVDMAEADIKRMDARLKSKEDTAVMLGREEKRLEGEFGVQVERVERISRLQEKLEAARKLDVMLGLGEVEAAYRDLKTSFRDEYVLYDVASLALAQVLTHFQLLFAGWDVLCDPRRGFAECSAWQPILLSDTQRDAIFEDVQESSDPFTVLISTICMPHIRSAITNRWEPRDPEPLIQLIEVWESVWPRAVLRHILESLVLPKMRAAVEMWEPRQERIAIHVWMHPWLPYLGAQLRDLYPTVVFRMANALQLLDSLACVASQSWHPSDGSAFALLSPWSTVFDSEEWDSLLVRSILPKLAFALQELVINPVAQDLKPFEWVLVWNDIVPSRHLVSLLESHFFPKWLQVLHHWLSNSPNYEEVTRWYIGWKEMIPEHLRSNDRVAAQLGIALNLMNSAVEGSGIAPLSTFLPTAHTKHAPDAEPSVRTATASTSAWDGSSSFTIRELVQHFAEENNVEFVPKPGRFHDGLQVYAFGTVNCVLENVQNTVRGNIHGQWVSLTLVRLLEEHHARVARGAQG